MSRCVIRASREEARYGVYSTIVDNFVWVNGTREETLDYLVDGYRPGTERYQRERAEAEAHLAKADERGSDSVMGRAGWNEDGLTIMNNQPYRDGRLPREHIGEFMRRVEADESTDDLLRLDDEEAES